MTSLLKYEPNPQTFLVGSKRKWLRSLSLLLVSFIVGFPVLAAPIGSVSPTELLKSLPPVPVEWKCQQSIGKVEFSVMDTPETTVIRQYQIPPNKDDLPAVSDAPVVPGHVHMMVMDLGSRGNPADNPPISAKPEESFPLALFTGRLQVRKNKDMLFSATIGSRLFVQITGQSIKLENFQKILQSLDFTALVKLEKDLPSVPLKENDLQEMKNEKLLNYKTMELENIYIDELNPQVNRTWKSTCIAPSP